MKKSTCRDLKGACDAVIVGATAEEMANNCRAHVMEMMQRGDEAHRAAVEAMKSLSQEEQMAWYQGFLAGFDSLPDA
jgi:hypothetical protein